MMIMKIINPIAVERRRKRRLKRRVYQNKVHDILIIIIYYHTYRFPVAAWIFSLPAIALGCRWGDACLWCSSTVRLLSTQTSESVCAHPC